MEKEKKKEKKPKKRDAGGQLVLSPETYWKTMLKHIWRGNDLKHFTKESHFREVDFMPLPPRRRTPRYDVRRWLSTGAVTTSPDTSSESEPQEKQAKKGLAGFKARIQK